MKRAFRCFALMLVFLMIPLQIPCMAFAPQDESGYIVKLKPEAEPDTLSFEPDMIGDDLCAVANASQAGELLRTGWVEDMTTDDVLTLQADVEAREWNQIRLGTEAAWNHTDASGQYDCRGDGVTVAIIDSGVYPHTDFDQARLVPVPEEFSGFTQWHGTFVAGIIAAQLNGSFVDGIVPNVNLMSLCVTDRNGNTTTSRVIGAMNYAIDHGADIINLSLGGTARNTQLEEACRKAVDAGVIVTACSGNASSPRDAGKNIYPAAFDCVISVSACEETEDGMQYADFSCYNDSVDACAPGAKIRGLYIDGGTVIKSGTSFSSPVVASMAAIAKQHDPNVTRFEFLNLLKDTCEDCGAPGRDPYYGYGIVNFRKFVDTVCSKQPVPQPDLAFVDVGSGDYFYEPVRWAVEGGITSGTDVSHFSPAAGCTRAQLVTFLYRAAGSPNPGIRSVPFTDVRSDGYYYPAVLWAYENGITRGVTDTLFDLNSGVTREQVVTFLWRSAGSHAPGGPVSRILAGYTDGGSVSAYAADAFVWALEQGVTTGTGPKTLGPKDSCLRGQIVTFLYRLK